MDLCNINEIKALLTRHGFHFSKAKGQNFLTQSWVPREIVLDAGIDDTCGVLEVGPGIGPLTQQLCRSAKKVVAWYGLGRAWIEGLRTDSLYLFSTGIRVSQLVAAVSFLAAAGIIAWVLLKKKPRREDLFVNHAARTQEAPAENPDEM